MTVSEGGSPQVFGGNGPLALCLSGGGFRAMFFHLGVVRLLQEVGCLKRVTHVFSVSGGSVLAGHLSLNWSAYTSGRETAFQDLSDALVRFGRDDLRGRIVRRWVLLRSRASTLQRQYDAFFKGARLRELPPTPTFHFLTTSMTTGRLCAFTRDAFLVVHEDGHVVSFPAEAQPVAQAVAASSAFPPLFPPLQLDLPDLPRAQFPIAEYLTDGGVFDNLGISRLHRLVSDATKAGFARIIVSDASALFDHAPDSRFLWLPSRASRTTDILMQRVASLESELWQREPGGRLTVLGISNVVADLPIGRYSFRPQPQKIQRLLKGVRTDFDAFDLDLIRSLVQHGHEVAFQAALASAIATPLDEYRRQALGKTYERQADDVLPWDPCPPGWPDANMMREHAQRAAQKKPLLNLMQALEQGRRLLGGEPSSEAEKVRDALATADRRTAVELETLIAAASRRPIGLWNRRDWASWILALLAVGIIAGTAAGALQLWRALSAHSRPAQAGAVETIPETPGASDHVLARVIANRSLAVGRPGLCLHRRSEFVR
jgi:predicted acylesterase/phospholipase RssA